jgi:hypothetical protein
MTKMQEFPLRPQGRPWAGINTRSGKLDDGSGQMTDSSVNCIINRADELSKRKGMVRGIDERFAGSVCGLHKYSDECGREWLLVADEGGFSVRQPFSIPSFAASDAYPSDAFASDGPVDTNFWNDTEGYEQAGGALVLQAGQSNPGDMTWFKVASNFSYQSVVDFTIDNDSTVVAIIKKAAVARLEARIVRVAGNGIVTLVWTDSSGSETVLGTAGINTATAGSMTLSYERNAVGNTFTAKLEVFPEGLASFVLEDSDTINALADSDLGQQTALRLESATGASSGTVLEIQGSPL